MTTIITVHGTNAADPSDHGEQWWQRDSNFQKRLSEYVDPIDGSLDFLPFHWSGDNSEIGRRRAARELLKIASKVDKRNEPFSIIGHSHGGSVAYQMLKEANLKLHIFNSPRIRLKKKPRVLFSNMHQWMTIGTPFINYKPLGAVSAQWTSFLSLWWFIPAASVVLMNYGIIRMARPSLYYYYQGFGHDTAAFVDHAQLVSIAVSLLLVLPLFFEFVRRSTRDPLRHTQLQLKKNAVDFRDKYEKNWAGFFHKKDEAIGALKIASTTETQLAPPTIGANQIAAVFGIVLSLGFLLLSHQLRDHSSWIYETPSSALENGLPTNIEIVGFLFSQVSEQIYYLATSGEILPQFLAFLYLVGIVVVFYSVSLPVAKLFARPISKQINAMISNLTRQKVFGSDLDGLSGPKIDTKPAYFATECGALPDELSEEIDSFVTEYAGEFLGKARTALGLVHAGLGNEEIVRQVSGTITWKELIHTAYFDVDNFIKLIAVSMCESGLVLPSQKLLADPEYGKVVLWHKHMLREPM